MDFKNFLQYTATTKPNLSDNDFNFDSIIKTVTLMNDN